VIVLRRTFILLLFTLFSFFYYKFLIVGSGLGFCWRLMYWFMMIFVICRYVRNVYGGWLINLKFKLQVK